jgi:hypothetical protein
MQLRSIVYFIRCGPPNKIVIADMQIYICGAKKIQKLWTAEEVATVNMQSRTNISLKC